MKNSVFSMFFAVLLVTVSGLAQTTEPRVVVGVSQNTPPHQRVHPGQRDVVLAIMTITAPDEGILISVFTLGSWTILNSYVTNIRVAHIPNNNIFVAALWFTDNIIDFWNFKEFTVWKNQTREIKFVGDISPLAPLGLTFNVGIRGGGDLIAYTISNTRLCLTEGGGLGNIILVDGTTDVASTNSTEFSLAQNYPNPFNPTTKISYSLPQRDKVSLKIFDYLGREMMVLVNEVKSVGNYDVVFDGKNLASGTYFYRLETNGKIMTKKMTLMK